MAVTVPPIVATTVMLFIPLVAADSPTETVSCQKSEVTRATITKPGSTLKLLCPESGYTVNPTCSVKVGDVFTDEGCTKKQPLSDLCPGATGAPVSGGTPGVSVTVPQLPATPTNFFFKCSKDPDFCTFAVSVSGAPPEGPQVCALKNSSVSLMLRGEGGSAQFACGSGLSLNPATSRKVFSEDCTTEKDLKDMTLSGPSDNYFVLKADKKPKKHTLCYVCGPPSSKGKGPETCAVLISVSAGSGLAAQSAFGLALPCVLALLHFT